MWLIAPLRFFKISVFRPIRLIVLCIAVCVMVNGCANPQQDRYAEALASLELEEQRLINQARIDRQSALADQGEIATGTGNAPNRNNENTLPDIPSGALSGMPSDTTRTVTQKPASIASQISTAPDNLTQKTNWWIERSVDPNTGAPVCLVVSQALSAQSQQDNVRSQLVLTDKALYLRASVPIDRNAQQASIRVDTQLPIALEQHLSESIAVLSTNYTAVLTQLLTGSFANASAVYDDGSDVPNLQIQEFTLEGFIRAYAQIDNC